MITREEHERARAYAVEQLAAAGIELRDEERDAIEVADFGLGRLAEVGERRSAVRRRTALYRRMPVCPIE